LGRGGAHEMRAYAATHPFRGHHHVGARLTRAIPRAYT
jgi:hypothetical protein